MCRGVRGPGVVFYAIITIMPTLLIQEGFKFFFYANEHEPKHIHVMKGGEFAKIELSTLRVVKNETR